MRFRHILPFIILGVFFAGVAYILHSLVDIIRTFDMDVMP